MALKLEPVERAITSTPKAPGGHGEQTSQLLSGEGQITALARMAVETFVLERRVIEPARSSQMPLLNEPAACFVCLKTFSRELRGCIGTVEPEKRTLADEVIANAIKAATRDTRFESLSAGELSSIRYSVDVLENLEPACLQDLDPSVFGVVVTNSSGSRRGLLLPAIDGIRTTDQQVSVAARKAGIAAHETLKLYRFRTHRFSE